MGLSPDDPVWDPTTFTKNRDRLQNADVFAKFMTKLVSIRYKDVMSLSFSVAGHIAAAVLYANIPLRSQRFFALTIQPTGFGNGVLCGRAT